MLAFVMLPMGAIFVRLFNAVENAQARYDP
jgi:hypothetical protein